MTTIHATLQINGTETFEGFDVDLSGRTYTELLEEAADLCTIEGWPGGVVYLDDEGSREIGRIDRDGHWQHTI